MNQTTSFSPAIYQLPNELLAHIFDQPNVPNESLLNLAMVSRAFHYFSLSLYLSRFGISDPSKRVELIFRDNTPPRPDALSGLKIALSLTSVEDMTCRFEGETDTSAGDHDVVIGHMRRLHAFIATLTCVGTVRLVWGNDHCGCCTLFNQGEGVDDGLRAWSDAMGRMLSALVARGCTALTVHGGRFMGHTYSFKGGRPENSTKKLFGFSIKNLLSRQRSNAELAPAAGAEPELDVLRGDKWRFGRAKETGSAIVLTNLCPEAHVDPKIAALTIQSMMFIVPPVLHWTISALRLPSMVALRMMNLSVKRKCWPALFTLIADNAPHLTELHLSRIRQLVPADLLHFLGRLPNLRGLRLGRAIDCIDSYDLGPFPDFPNLTRLHAPAGWVFKLLSSQRKGLLRLTALSITYNLRNDGLSHWLRRSGAKSIPLLLKEQYRPLTVTLKIRLGRNPVWRMLEDVEAANRDGAGPDVDSVANLKLVFDEELEVSEGALAKVLPRWLALFFGLRRLTVKTQPKVMSTAAATALVVGMLKQGALAEISSVEVNGVEVNEDTTCEEVRHATVRIAMG